MEENSTDNAKNFDSGYSNMCSNSQSQTSSDNSLARNCNQSKSSGYSEGHSSTSTRSNEILPQLINERKDKENKKKRKPKATSVEKIESDLTTNNVSSPPKIANSYSLHTAVSNATHENKTEELAVVEMVAAMDSKQHNNDLVSDFEAGLGSRTNPQDDSNSHTNDDFYVLISMNNGLVAFTTISPNTPLGYLKEDWMGKSFIDFIRPEDKMYFIDHVNGAAMYQEESLDKLREHKATLFCKLRKNNKTCECEASDLYIPYRLKLALKHFPDRMLKQQLTGTFLVISAQRISSAYKVPNEATVSPTFTTQHLATCHLSHVALDVVKYLGYLPQDIIGCSIFDFYHPEDLSSIKDIYETVMKLDSTPFRSKPYRFIVQNGGYVIFETEWSRFINPWTKKLEFVVGQHRVLRGPTNPDVFQVPTDKDKCCLANVSNDILKQAKIIQAEIRNLLNEKKTDVSTNDVGMRNKDVASYTEQLPNDHPAVDDRSLSEHDCLMLGEISSHHVYCDSTFSTETVPSYNQLNYNENIERYFNSKPETNAFYTNSDEDRGSSVNQHNSKPRNHSSSSTANDSGSAANSSSDSNNQTSLGSKDESKSDEYTDKVYKSTLTESLLNKHNEDMEKLMIQKHKQLRFNIKDTDKQKATKVKPIIKKTAVQTYYPNKCQGVKRNRSQSREVDFHSKISKQDAKMRSVKRVNNSMRMDVDSTKMSTTVPISIDQDQQFAMVSNSNQAAQQMPKFATFSSTVPMYYVPLQLPRMALEPNNNNTETSNGNASIPRHLFPYPTPFFYLTPAIPGIVCPSIIGNSTTANVMFKGDQKTPTVQENNQSQIVNNIREKPRTNQNTPTKPRTNVIMNTETSSKPAIAAAAPDQLKKQIPKCRPRPELKRQDPPWLKGVQMTPKLIYEYQLDSKSLDEVLQSDRNLLQHMQQSQLVNSQLDQLYLDLGLEDFGAKLILDGCGSDSEFQVEWEQSDL